MSKKRLDVILCEEFGFETRNKAQEAIKRGTVFLNGKCLKKCGEKIDHEKINQIEFSHISHYVSRGAFKLLGALKIFDIEMTNKVAMDLGASTGGFTQVLLENGIKKVFSIDVGHSQLHNSLREDNRVVNIEKTNFRTMQDKDLYNKIDVITGDLSFISLTLIYENALNYLKKDGEIIFLIKPQFECDREDIGKNGIVKDLSVHEKCIKKIQQLVLDHNGYISGLCKSDIKGSKSGNQEYLVHIKNHKGDPLKSSFIRKVVYS